MANCKISSCGIPSAWLFITLMITFVASSLTAGHLLEGSAARVRLGCFEDSSDRDLPVEHRGYKLVNKQYCINYCSTRGYRYVGLQHSEWCFCGNSYAKHRRVADAECNRRCAGNSSETCGDVWRNEVFTTGVEDWESKITPLGCFVDSEHSRDLPVMFRADSRTSRHFCWDYCQSRGFRYFGMQQATWCVCGNAYGRHGRAGGGSCNFRCPHDRHNSTCGARLKSQIFSTGIQDWEANSTSLGCFEDRANRDLPLVHTAGSLASRQYCWHYCKSRGYKYFGLQDRQYCTCGNSYGRYDQLSSSFCDTRCRGEAGATCGGHMKNEIFTTGVEDWQQGVYHLGCFADGSTRDLELEHYIGNEATRFSCWKLCRPRGYKYFALQAHGHCFCGNWFGHYTHESTTQCGRHCYGDPTTTCGGDMRNDVFSTGIDDSAPLIRIGCFEDRQEARDLPLVHGSGEVTKPGFCRHYCAVRGHRYFGLQNGVWCLCGDSYGRYGRLEDSRCSVACGGDSSANCGGSLTNEVYETGISEWEKGVFRLGCFIDSSDRDLPELHGASQLVSRHYCWSYCSSRGYKYFGIQAGDHCSCGDSYGRHGQVRDEECSSRCHKHTGDVTCGSTWRNEIFTTGIEPWGAGVSRVGCFIDSSGSKDLPLVHSAGEQVRKQYCWNFCHSRGYRYFGLQSGDWCTCGNSYGKYGQVNSTECNIRCAADPSETCGAKLRNEIFTTGLGDWEKAIIRLGCFQDSTNRDLSVLHHAGKVTSRYYCWKYCKSRSYKYFGVQAIEYCTCGDSYGRYKRVGDGECRQKCLGDNTTTCGGNMRNELFTTGVDHWERQAVNIGCFKDRAEDRDLPLKQQVGEMMSKHYCWNFCRTRGYRYFGMQARQFCYCGNSYGRHGPELDPSQCRERCLGDYSTTCGGEMANEIFETGIEAWEQGLSRLGCYKDSSDRDLPMMHDAGNRMTKKFCWKFCRSLGLKYFGLQERRFCYCGNSYGKHGKVDDAECNQRCRGDASTTCGADMRNEVFETGVGDWDQEVKYLGCFVDHEDRDLPLGHYMGRVASQHYCWNFCTSRGYKYFALQAKTLCSCGNSYGRYGNARESECNQMCKGDYTVKCGGEMRNQVFSTGFAVDWENSTKSLGCFKDESTRNRDLPVMLHSGQQTTKFHCWSQCKSRGYRYFALQAAQWCTCGNSYGKFGPADDGDCNQRCLGDAMETCGGHLRNEVFTTGREVDE